MWTEILRRFLPTNRHAVVEYKNACAHIYQVNGTVFTFWIWFGLLRNAKREIVQSFQCLEPFYLLFCIITLRTNANLIAYFLLFHQTFCFCTYIIRISTHRLLFLRSTIQNNAQRNREQKLPRFPIEPMPSFKITHIQEIFAHNLHTRFSCEVNFTSARAFIWWGPVMLLKAFQVWMNCCKFENSTNGWIHPLAQR